MNSSEIRFWKHVAEDLELDIVTPFALTLPNGFVLTTSALVKHFGLPNGMVVDEAWSTFKDHTQTLLQSGYGFAAFSGGSADRYVRTSMIEVFADWGWSGAADKQPLWLVR